MPGGHLVDFPKRLSDPAVMAAAHGRPSPERASPAGGPIVYLFDVRDRFEATLLRQWLGPQAHCVEIDERDHGAMLEAALQGPDETWLQPVRLAWLAKGADRSAGLLTDLFDGRRVQPGPLRRRWLARHRPGRMARVIGEGAHLLELRRRWEDRIGRDGFVQGFAAFVATQATLDLERAERRMRGARYRIARLLPDDVFADRPFQEELARIGRENGEAGEVLSLRAARYLREMAAMLTPFSLDLIMALYRAGIRGSHDPQVDFDRGQLTALDSLMASRSVVFLISHKSMLDTVAFSVVLFDANMPVPLTFGGINLKTFGVGALARRAGIIFLRRAFQDNALYKAVFRRYIDYLIEKRFALLWALEGTRSRTGKLLAPRYGLFRYVLEASLRSGNSNLAWVPVSVAYDQITEVEDYANEQRGQGKKREGVGWMLRFFRRKRSHGRIFLRLGKPFGIDDLVAADTTLASASGAVDARRSPPAASVGATSDTAAGIGPRDDDALRVPQQLVQRVAIESALRLNAATPVTASAIMTLILLGAGRRAQRLSDVQVLARAGVALLRRRQVEIVGPHDFRSVDALHGALDPLHQAGLINYFDDGLERLVSIAPNQHHKAAYYRNTAIHWFVLDAIGDLALLEAALHPDDEPLEAFFRHAEMLRELLMFDFYFPPRDAYRASIAAHLDDRAGQWRDALVQGRGEAIFAGLMPVFAAAVLRAVLDAYRVVATLLVRQADAPVTRVDSSLLGQAQKLGRQMLLQEILVTPESASRPLHETGFALAARRGLLAAVEGGPALGRARQRWLDDLRIVCARLDRCAWQMQNRGTDAGWRRPGT